MAKNTGFYIPKTKVKGSFIDELEHAPRHNRKSGSAMGSLLKFGATVGASAILASMLSKDTKTEK